MSYTKTVWTNDAVPAINATNLNNIENGIKGNEAKIDSLVLGENLKGEFTPSIAQEYPLSPAINDSWYIDGLTGTGYTFTTGVLTGQTADNFDKLVYISTGWFLVEDTQNYVHNTGDETISGVKTFSSSPIVPAPTTDLQASTKKYVDDEIAAIPAPPDSIRTEVRNAVISSPNGVLAEDVTPTPSHIDVIYTGNGTSQDIVTGLPSESRPWVASASYTAGQYRTHLYVIYQALTTHSGVATTPDADATNWVAIADGVHVLADNADVWIKNRDVAVDNHKFDTLRGLKNSLETNTTDIEFVEVDAIRSYNVDGFTIGGSGNVNQSPNGFIAWCEYFDKMFSFTTNHGKRGICAYNAQSGKFMVTYQGSGTAGHEIPHGVGTKPDFFVAKNRDSIVSWVAQISTIDYEGGEYLILDTNAAIAVSPAMETILTSSAVSVSTTTGHNTLNENYIMYGSSNRDNHSKVVSYVGTGLAGNEVDVGMDLATLDTAGKNVKVMAKAISGAESWVIMDTGRGIDNYLYADTSAAEGALDIIDLTSNGFVLKSAVINGAGVQYLVEVTIEDFDNPNGGLTVNPNNTVSYAEGTDATSGDKDTIETLTGGAVSLTAGTTNYIYADKGDVLGATIYPLLEVYPYVTHDANSDTYDVAEGKMYNTSGIAISRTYLGSVVVDGSGEIIPDTIQSYTVGRKQVTELIAHSTVNFKNLPTVDTGVEGTLWNDAGTIKISSGV